MRNGGPGAADGTDDEVEGAAVGDDVFGTAATGAAAQYAVLAERADKPGSLSFEEAAGYPMVTETARQALNLLPWNPARLSWSTAAGGGGPAAVQFVLTSRATMIGTDNEGNHEYLRSPDAMPASYGPELVGRVRGLATHGVNVAFDAEGGEGPAMRRSPCREAAALLRREISADGRGNFSAGECRGRTCEKRTGPPARQIHRDRHLIRCAVATAMIQLAVLPHLSRYSEPAGTSFNPGPQPAARFSRVRAADDPQILQRGLLGMSDEDWEPR